MAAISGTSASSSGTGPSTLCVTAQKIANPVVTHTRLSTSTVDRSDQRRMAYTSVKLTQMKWNGIVSHRPMRKMVTRLMRAKQPQATSIQRLRNVEPIANVSHRLDDAISQLGSQPTNVDINHIAAVGEAQPPHVPHELLPRADIAVLEDQLMQDRELALGKPHRSSFSLRRTSNHVQDHGTRPDESVGRRG